MITLNRRRGFFPYRIVWFSDRPRFHPWPVTIFCQSSQNPPIQGLICQNFWTLTQALNQSDEEFLAKMKATTRNEVKQAIAFDFKGEWGNLDDFCFFFNQFAKKSKIKLVSQAKLLSFNDHLVLTQVRHPQKGHVLAMHAYLTDADLARVRLLFSASSTSLDIERHFIGKANRFLHFWDMIEFRQKGFLVYDWGGIAKNTHDSKKHGINRFKESFGGQENCEYHYYPFYMIGQC